MEEVWKDINRYEGIYQISNYGNLKSFKSETSGKVLSNVNKNGDYFCVVLTNNAKKKKRYVRIHTLVAEHFIGERPKGFHVHHKDGNKQNNKVGNLEYISTKDHYRETLKENPQIVTGMVNYNKFVKPKSVLQFSLDGNFIAEYRNAQIAGRVTGVCSRNILQVANQDEYKPGRVRKQAGGFVWRVKGGDLVCS